MMTDGRIQDWRERAERIPYFAYKLPTLPDPPPHLLRTALFPPSPAPGASWQSLVRVGLIS